MIEAFPLAWPQNWPRVKTRRKSRFQNTSFDLERRHLLNEVRRLGGKNTILSTNLPLRRDGAPYASASYSKLSDPGVAIYFNYKDKPMSFACDAWDRIEDNMKAVGKTIEAIRGIERWGASDMMERAFTGFQALPAPKTKWWEILGVSQNSTKDEIKEAYRKKARECHPDFGGSTDQMAIINSAYEQATA